MGKTDNVERLKRVRCMRRFHVGAPEPVGLILVTVLDNLGKKIKEVVK